MTLAGFPDAGNVWLHGKETIPSRLVLEILVELGWELDWAFARTSSSSFFGWMRHFDCMTLLSLKVRDGLEHRSLGALHLGLDCHDLPKTPAISNIFERTIVKN